MDFLDPEARRLLAAAGATVGGDGHDQRVPLRPGDGRRDDRAPARRTFRLHSWNPAHTLTIGGDRLAFGSVGSPPNIVDLDGRRRPGDRDGVPRPAQAVPVAQHRPLHRRLPGRADRPASVGPPPRSGPRRADAHRQGPAQLQPRRPAQPGRARDGAHRPPGRRRHARARAVGVHRRQLVVAAAPRRPDAAGDDRVRRRATRSS